MRWLPAGRSDLPRQGDATSRFLPWLIAPMVFLSAIALSGVFVVNTLIDRWNRDVSGTLTVEIAVAAGEAGPAMEKTRAETDEALRILKATPGVASARALSQAELSALLAPWLGDSDQLKELPLPALIDVTLQPEARPDLEALKGRLDTIGPGISLDDHRRWLSRLIDLSRSAAWLAIAMVILIGAVTSATVVYATRTGLAVHGEVIEVLHLIGATDDYIARQFATRAFALGLKGGIAGVLLTIPALAAIAIVARRIEGGFLADLSLPLAGWIAVAALAPAAALLAMLTARLTVHGTLARVL